MSTAPYTVILTHDVDRLSFRGLPFAGREQAALLKDMVWGNATRTLRGRITPGDFLRSAAAALALPFTLAGLAPDLLENTFARITALEAEYGARSTFFFVPFARRAGHTPQGRPASAHRAVHYRLSDWAGLVRALVAQGWDVGVHAIDAHTDPRAADEERAALARIVGPRYPLGARVHWLYETPALNRNLAQAGYAYNATPGWNDSVGFPGGRYQPYTDAATGLPIVPLNIQDTTLLREDRMGLGPKAAWNAIERLLEEARRRRGVISVLWHNDSFVPPRAWDRLYRRLLERARADGAALLSVAQALKAAN